MLDAAQRALLIAQQLAKNNRLPRLDLFVSGGVDLGPEPYEKRRGELLFGVSIKLPILLRKARGELQSARRKHRALGEKMRLAADEITAQVRDIHSALSAARQSLAVARRELVVAKRVEGAERQRLMLGASSLLTVNLREQAAAEAEFRAAAAAATLHRALASYRAVTVRHFTTAPAKQMTAGH